MAQKKATTSQRSTSTKTRAAAARTRNDTVAHPDGAPTARDIERRAYEIYISRGGAPGADVDDWLQAERELTARKDRTG